MVLNLMKLSLTARTAYKQVVSVNEHFNYWFYSVHIREVNKVLSLSSSLLQERLNEKDISFLQLTNSSLPYAPQIYFNFVVYQLKYVKGENTIIKPVSQLRM